MSPMLINQQEVLIRCMYRNTHKSRLCVDQLMKRLSTEARRNLILYFPLE